MKPNGSHPAHPERVINARNMIVTGDVACGLGLPQRATMTVADAAEVLGISRSTAYELVRSGSLPALRLGRRIVVPTHALSDLLNSVNPVSADS